jgi:hypothetical protein
VVWFKASPISALITHFLDFSTDFLFTILIRFLIFTIYLFIIYVYRSIL